MNHKLQTFQNSPIKVTAFSQKFSTASKLTRDLSDDHSLVPKLSVPNFNSLGEKFNMNQQEYEEILRDYGYDYMLQKQTRPQLESLIISKKKLKQLAQVLAKEPHEKSREEVEELRKMLIQISFFQEYVTNNDFVNLNQHDLNDLSKLLIYQRIQDGEEIQLYGEKSSKMYIILKGKVALARPIKNKNTNLTEHLNNEGTFQTQITRKITRKMTKRQKLLKEKTQIDHNPQNQTQLTFNGIPCRFLVTEEIIDANGNLQKVKKPHPIYQEVAEMQSVLDNLNTQTFEIPAFRQKIDETIELKKIVTESERAFYKKLEDTMIARKLRERANHLHVKQQDDSETHSSHISHKQSAHQAHLQRIKEEEEKIQQIVFHDKPTIIQHKERRQSDSSPLRRQSQYPFRDSIQETNELDELNDLKGSISEQLGDNLEPDTAALAAIEAADSQFDTDQEISDDELPVDCDEQDNPLEEIFDYLSAGQYFGQLSLLDNNNVNKASVYTKQQTHLLVIDKIAFEKMLALHQKRYEAELLAFLKTIPLFRRFPNSLLKRLVGYFFPVSKILHSYLYRENELASHVYIVKEGLFRSTRRVAKDQSAQKNLPHAKEAFEDPKKSMIGQSQFFIKNVVNQYETVELQILGRNQIIGDEDCSLSLKYNTTVQCLTQTAQLIGISRENFRRIEQQATYWAMVLQNSEEKILRYHEKMRQFKFVRLYVGDEMQKLSGPNHDKFQGAQKFVAGEDIMKQHKDRTKGPSGELVEIPIFRPLTSNKFQSVTSTQRMIQQSQQSMNYQMTSTLKKNYQTAISTIKISDKLPEKLITEEDLLTRKVTTAINNTRKPPLQAQIVGNLHKKNAVSQVFDKYQSPGSAALVYSASSKVAQNSKGQSTADTLQYQGTRKLQTTAYLKFKDQFKHQSIQNRALSTANKNLKYSMSWNLSPSHNQPQVSPPMALKNVI